MPSRRLEDHIRELCLRLLSAGDKDALPLIVELREALREHARRLETLAQLKLVGNGHIRDRRNHRRHTELVNPGPEQDRAA
jgi:hypothetical protein